MLPTTNHQEPINFIYSNGITQKCDERFSSENFEKIRFHQIKFPSGRISRITGAFLNVILASTKVNLLKKY
jgi:hypothetical protein